MDKPINQINSIKSLEELKSYLEQRSQLNLALLSDKNKCTLLHSSSFKNDLPRMKIYIKYFKQFTELNHGTGLYTGGSSFGDKLRAWVNSPNQQGYIPLFYAALHGNIQMIKFLEECGSNMYYKTTKQENVLFMCIEYNRIKTLIYLVESSYNYDLNQKNIHGDTILHHACLKGYTQLVSYLLTVGADIQATNHNGQTPLLVATRQGKKQVIRLLLIKGANRHTANKDGLTSLQIARANNKEQLVKILNDQYTFCDKIKIKCNKKIVYQPQKSSYLYSIYFIVLFHLFFLPINILSQFNSDEKYVKVIPLMFEGIFELIVFLIYCLLLRKPKKKTPEQLLEIDGNFCAECKLKLNDKTFHCYICDRCIYRYDHHCPWINNCVGAHNVGKFTFFLFILILGLGEVIFCCIMLILGDHQNIIRYRKNFSVPDEIHMPLNIITILFSTLLLFGLLKLFFEQVRNLATNSTGLERKKQQASTLKKKQLLSSETSMSDSMIKDFDDQIQEQRCNCFGNCMNMLSQDY